MSFQDAFAQALFAPGAVTNPAVRQLAAQPAFAVYRNTVMKACIDALEANFPAVARLVGSEWFRAAAALHVAASPPRDGRLLNYGEGFADFLQGFEPATELPVVFVVEAHEIDLVQIDPGPDEFEDPRRAVSVRDKSSHQPGRARYPENGH